MIISLASRTMQQQLQHDKEKIGVIIPVYGENDAICWVLERFNPQLAVSTICLVIDVPLRKVMRRVRDAARACGITVQIIKNENRMGIGYSIRQGLEYLMESEHDLAVVMAGNGKDDPLEIPRIVKPVLERRVDYTQGSRYRPGGRYQRMPLVRKVFNRIFPFLWTILTDRKCTDVTNGFRCYRLSVLKDPRINIQQEWLDGYSLEYYLHYKILSLHYKMKEVAVSKIYPFGHKGGYSKIQPLRDWWSIISPLVLLFLGVRS
jgi:dolichol-phosphate mannosyltransferase